MSKLNELIQRIEDDNALTNVRGYADEINEILVDIGVKPIVKDESSPGMRDGSKVETVQLYMSLVTIRGLIS